MKTTIIFSNAKKENIKKSFLSSMEAFEALKVSELKFGMVKVLEVKITGPEENYATSQRMFRMAANRFVRSVRKEQKMLVRVEKLHTKLEKISASKAAKEVKKEKKMLVRAQLTELRGKMRKVIQHMEACLSGKLVPQVA